MEYWQNVELIVKLALVMVASGLVGYSIRLNQEIRELKRETQDLKQDLKALDKMAKVMGIKRY